MKAMQQVPGLYFEEDFSLGRYVHIVLCSLGVSELQ